MTRPLTVKERRILWGAAAVTAALIVCMASFVVGVAVGRGWGSEAAPSGYGKAPSLAKLNKILRDFGLEEQDSVLGAYSQLGLLMENVGGASPEPGVATHQITYVVQADRPVKVSYTDRDGGTEAMVVTPPWRKTVRLGAGHTVLIAAYVASAESAEVTVEILQDGRPWKQSKRSGPAALAWCSGCIGYE